MLNRDQQLIVPASEAPGQRLIAGLHNHSFPHHIPELLLGYPVFLAVVAYDQGSFFDFHIRPTVSEFSRVECVQFVSTKSDHEAPPRVRHCVTATVARQGYNRGWKTVDRAIAPKAILNLRSSIFDLRSSILFA